MNSADEVLLELSAAARAAGLNLRIRPRARLEIAVAQTIALIKQPNTQNISKDQAISRLRSALDLCRSCRVDWSDVVAIVNKEDGF
jgi:hypothetical protein